MNLSRYWTNSIEWQEGSSGGQSPEDCMMQWNPELSNLEIGTCAYGYSLGRATEPKTTYEITINMAGSSAAMLGRYLGCIMLGSMPDEGLEEALFSLRDMLEFYSYKPAPHPARLAPKAITATIADKRNRPDLVLTE